MKSYVCASLALPFQCLSSPLGLQHHLHLRHQARSRSAISSSFCLIATLLSPSQNTRVECLSVDFQKSFVKLFNSWKSKYSKKLWLHHLWLLIKDRVGKKSFAEQLLHAIHFEYLISFNPLNETSKLGIGQPSDAKTTASLMPSKVSEKH